MDPPGGSVSEVSGLTHIYPGNTLRPGLRCQTGDGSLFEVEQGTGLCPTFRQAMVLGLMFFIT